MKTKLTRPQELLFNAVKEVFEQNKRIPVMITPNARFYKINKSLFAPQQTINCLCNAGLLKRTLMGGLMFYVPNESSSNEGDEFKSKFGDKARLKALTKFFKKSTDTDKMIFDARISVPCKFNTLEKALDYIIQNNLI